MKKKSIMDRPWHWWLELGSLFQDVPVFINFEVLKSKADPGDNFEITDWVYEPIREKKREKNI